MTCASDPPSSLLAYLPPFVRAEGDPSGRFLDCFLRIFEAILIGRPDAPPHVHLPFEAMIDRLPDLFDPWGVPARFVPFLAARVGLALDPTWDDYHQRGLIEMAVGIYQQRWLKRGLYRFLDLYASTAARPRVVIDDGATLLAGRLRRVGGVETADLHPIAFARPGPPDLPLPPAAGKPDPVPNVLRDALANRRGAALTHPVAMAVGQRWSAAAGAFEPEFVVADAGPWDLPNGVHRVGLWRLSPSGQFLDWTAETRAVPRPLNAGDPGAALLYPAAVLAEPGGSYLVLDGQARAVYRYTPRGRLPDPVVPSTQLNAAAPVDMAFDHDGNLLVLDQSPPRLLRVMMAPPGTPPVPAKAFNLDPAVVLPTALLVEPAGTVLLTDVRDKSQTAADVPADLVRVTLADPPAVTRLLKDLPLEQNPLVYPAAIVAGAPGAGAEASVLVCDWGLKQGFTVPLERVRADPAGLYRITLPSPPGVVPPVATSVTRIQLNAPLVTPMHLAWDGPRLLVLDYGSFRPSDNYEWRTRPHQFGVVVDFSATRHTEPEQRQQFFLTLVDLLNRERPAHVTWQFQTQPDQATNRAVPDLALAPLPFLPPTARGSDDRETV